MLLRIPFSSTPNETFTTVLGGVEYRFEVSYNERSAMWIFDLLLESSGATLAAGIPILLGCDMLAPYGLGIGSMFAVDLSATAAEEVAEAGTLLASVDAGPDDLGVRVAVFWQGAA